MLFVIIVTVAILLAVGILVYRRYYGNRADRFGYASRAAYLQAVPRTDAERRDAVDQTFKGLVICLLGLILPPFMLVGLVPLFFGGRKTVYVLMGLGLADEADPPDA